MRISQLKDPKYVELLATVELDQQTLQLRGRLRDLTKRVDTNIEELEAHLQQLWRANRHQAKGYVYTCTKHWKTDVFEHSAFGVVMFSIQ
jgi:hypothetical protein